MDGLLGAFCPICGQQAGDGTGTDRHLRCAAAAELEPPRYCVECGRRMVVQVTPLGWSASCSRHGVKRSEQTS